MFQAIWPSVEQGRWRAMSGGQFADRDGEEGEPQGEFPDG